MVNMGHKIRIALVRVEIKKTSHIPDPRRRNYLRRDRGGFLALTHDLPQIRSLENFRPSAVTRIVSADGVLLAELFAEKRDPVPLDTIPDYLTSALMVTEDRKFFKHSGVDLKGILRAVIKDIMAREIVEGASTITQQLAKTLFLTPKKTIKRKIREAILAFQLERRYTKNEILELYLNQVYFGSGAYGVESAARVFFQKSVKDLNLAESALIAGMPKAPSRYSPLVNPERAKKRRNIVLKQMRDTEIITETQFLLASKEPISPPGRKNRLLKAPYFVEYVKKNLQEMLGSAEIYKNGYTVLTSLSFELQQVAERAVEKGISELAERMKLRKISEPDPQCALVSMDLATGGIIAMIGGRDFYESPFNRAVSAERQPGSAFKPIVYALAVEKGFPQNMVILDAPIVFKGGKDGQDWRPENFYKSYLGEITLRKALAQSENIPAVRLIEMLGPASVAKFGHNLGITSEQGPNLSLALGTSDVKLIELTAAYGVFANQGEWIKPQPLIRILDHNARVVWRARPEKRVAMSRAGAAIMTNMLIAVVQEGTGRKARFLKHPLAGKTGTTNEYKDALFVGFSPSVATGVWVGQDEYVTLGNKETGARAALPIWIEFMAKAIEKYPYQYFDIPDDVVQVRIDPLSGRPAPDSSPDAVPALFKRGTEP